MINKNLCLFFMTMISCFFSTGVYAQFAGDIFFDKPSVSVSTGNEVELSLSLFSGAYIFGAAEINLSFNPEHLSLVSVKYGSSTEVSDSLHYKVDGGVIKILVMNSISKTKPIGTVNLAKIRFKAITQSAVVSRVVASIPSLLATNNSFYPRKGAFNAEIVISNVSMASRGSGIAKRDISSQPSADLLVRAEGLAPPGSKINMLDLDGGVVVDYLIEVPTVADASQEE